MADRSHGTAGSTDTETTNKLEELALSVPAPGPSLRSARFIFFCKFKLLNFSCDILADTGTISGLEKSRPASHCQTWMRELVSKPVENGLLQGGANTVIANAPKN